MPLYHFDLYRLRGISDFLELGFAEYVGGDGVALIEWPERLEGWKIPNARALYFSHTGIGTRDYGEAFEG